MKKFSSSLVFLCLTVSVLLLACSHDGEAFAPLPPGTVNGVKRRQMGKTEVTEQFHLDPIHTTLDKFENKGFTLKTHQMFSVQTTPEEF